MTGLKECSVEGCGKSAHARGLCGAHYYRWRTHGSPLGGGTFKGQLERFFREVVLTFNGNECLIWPYTTYPKGYGQIRYDGRAQTVSRLACEMRYGPPPSSRHQAAHSCGKGHEGCVNPKHLRWATPTENHADKLIHGTHNRGERDGAAKLTESDVHQIRMLKGTISQCTIAKQFGVHPVTISQIQRRETWAWLQQRGAA